MEKSKHLIIGAGEAGTSVFNVLKKHYEADMRDIDGEVGISPEVLHICFPYTENFLEETKKYIKQYNPSLIIIHSTVKPGTTSQIGNIAVHSPIRGVHSDLERGIKTFVKYFGGPKAKEAANYFGNIGIKTEIFDKAETTEVLKILSTTYYGWNIVFYKEVERICSEMGLDFEEVYTIPNQDYNKGYRELGMDYVVRPVLKPMPGKIGGHCIVSNCDLLESWITEMVKKRNSSY